MNIHLQIQPLLALVAGIAVLVVPRFLTWIVGGYLIVLGVLGLLGR